MTTVPPYPLGWPVQTDSGADRHSVRRLCWNTNQKRHANKTSNHKRILCLWFKPETFLCGAVKANHEGANPTKINGHCIVHCVFGRWGDTKGSTTFRARPRIRENESQLFLRLDGRRVDSNTERFHKLSHVPHQLWVIHI